MTCTKIAPSNVLRKRSGARSPEVVLMRGCGFPSPSLPAIGRQHQRLRRCPCRCPRRCLRRHRRHYPTRASASPRARAPGGRPAAPPACPPAWTCRSLGCTVAAVRVRHARGGCAHPVRTVRGALRGALGASRPAPAVRTQRGRPVRVARTYPTEAPRRACQLRLRAVCCARASTRSCSRS